MLNPEQVDPPKGIGDVKLRQIKELAEYWPIVLGVGIAAYSAISFFATGKSVENLECKLDKQIIVQSLQSSVNLLQRQSEDISKEIENLLNLKSLLSEIKSKNPSIDLSELKEEMNRLEQISRVDRNNKKLQIEEENHNLKNANVIAANCGK
jgi:TPP-dependent 2-oxoacid decarboxylase